MNELVLDQKTVFITGASRRIGRALAVACAEAGADVIVHYAHSEALAEETRRLVVERGRRAWILQGDFSNPKDVARVADSAFALGPVHALVNNAAIFGPAGLAATGLDEWEHHMAINLTAPFLLSQSFGRTQVVAGGRIVNILDWRALRPGADHFAYTVSKAALAAMTQSLAQALGPNVSVNGLALGAILPPEDGLDDPGVLRRVPAGRWGTTDEVAQALLFLLGGPTYVTGEIIYVDGGRHLS
ncbi:MAG TPA: SDR family oxidoreductase [Anaerolineales bacterium]|nr:SDR family oxidoreductase [Anaerolineales bacterium]